MSNKRRGFTLVELLISMGILSILLVIFSQVFAAVFQTQLTSEAEAAVSQDTRYVYSRLAYDIARSSVINVPNAPGVSGQSLQLTINGGSYLYSLNSNNLVLSVNGGAAQQLNGVGTKISELNFTRIGGATGRQSVQINLTMESTTQLEGGRKVTSNLITAVGTR